MKTFKDLKFKSYKNGNGLQATMGFDNGYGVSVIRFKIPGMSVYGSYTANDREWELAVLKDDKLCYTTPITDDVVGNLTDEGVTKIMEQLQKLERE